MKVSELNALIESIVTNEVKKGIMEGIEESKTVYHVMCNGEPVNTFHTEEEALQHVDELKQGHPDKEFIIEKVAYESHDDMIDKLDEMGEKLENESENMEPKEGNAFTGALAAAKASHKKEFNVGGKEFDVKEDWDNPTGAVGHGVASVSEEDECNECGDGYMEEDLNEYEPIMEDENICECGGIVGEEGMCNECGKMWEQAPDGDSQYNRLEEGVCPKCGKEICECGSIGMEEEGYMGTPYASSEDMAVDMVKKGIYHESKKRTIRLKENELVSMIKDMVNEAMKGEPGAPGIPGLVYTKKAQTGSKKENSDAMKSVGLKMKDYLNFDGNDHSEFPHQNGVATKKEARVNSKEEDDEVAKNFAGLQNLDYDTDPGDKFKDRMKKAIEGHSTMGNGETEKASIDPSNGAEKGKESKEKVGNQIKTETPKKLEKQIKDRQKDKENRVLYPKEKIPVQKLNESKIDFSKILNEEIEKMRRLTGYNKKTQ